MVDIDFLASVDVCDSGLITESWHGAYENHGFIPPREDSIRNAQATDVPMVGICIGHQIIAQNLGGKVTKFDEEYLVGCPAYRGGFDDIMLNAWHQDQVLTLLTKAKSIAHNAFCKNAAVFYGQPAFTCNRTPNLAIR